MGHHSVDLDDQGLSFDDLCKNLTSHSDCFFLRFLVNYLRVKEGMGMTLALSLPLLVIFARIWLAK